MTKKELDKVRFYIINNIIRDSSIMYDENIREAHGDIDLIEVIASLYELLHREVAKEPYDYMFHYANKVGSWVESDLFTKED